MVVFNCCLQGQRACGKKRVAESGIGMANSSKPLRRSSRGDDLGNSDGTDPVE